MTSALPTFASSEIFSQLKQALPDFNQERMQKAYHTAKKLYGEQNVSGSHSLPLLDQVCGMLPLVCEFCPDEDSVIACLLQHSLRSSEYSVQQLEEQFGKNVRNIVSRLHLLSHLNATEWKKSIDDMKIMLVSVSDDIRVILLRLCLQVYLLEHLKDFEPAAAMRFARESLQIFAPVAARLGIYALKYKLEDRAFPVIYPVDNDNIDSQLDILHKEDGQFLPEVTASLQAAFARDSMQVRVTAREKHRYSIFQKMQLKSVADIRKITDLIALRIIVKNPDDCYQALGLLHRLARPVSQRFKDYIAFPKPNGYQSLHTCVIGLPHAPKSLMVEVQIRSEDMHREAEYGIAAHWMYKEGSAVKRSTYSMQLTDILQQQELVNEERGKSTKGDSRRLVDHIYVLTPRGDIRELPDGSTPLDFAFLIHTDLGLKYKGARVNGSIVPVGHKLENGDIVEILTHATPRPSLQWLEQLTTASGRSKLKNYFFSHNRSEFLTRGRDAVNEELKTRHLPQLDAEMSILKIVDGKVQTPHEREDLLVKIGMGSVKTSSIFRHIGMEKAGVRRLQSKKAFVPKKDQLITIDGAPIGMPYRFAKCCSVDTQKPRPENIIGFITRLGSVTIHRDGCRMVRDANRDRRVKAMWIK